MSDRRRDSSKLSFAELDKLRRERKHRPEESSGRSERMASKHAQKSYRAALERAFESGTVHELVATLQRTRDPHSQADASDRARPVAAADEVPPDPAAAPAPPTAEPMLEPAVPPTAEQNQYGERRRLTRQIIQADSPRAVGKAIDRYLERFDEFPSDYEVLERALSHPKSPVVIKALETLETSLAAKKPRRSRSLAVQLAILEDTHEDSDVRDLAARVRAAL